MPVDRRFYAFVGPKSASELAALSDGVVAGSGDALAYDLAPLGAAGDGDLCFCDGAARPPARAEGAVCFVSEQAASGLPESVHAIVSRLPRHAFGLAAKALYQPRDWGEDDPRIHPTATLEPGARIGPGACIGPRARIGAYAVIGPGVQIGADTSVGAHASVRFSLIGDHVQILAGARLGETGFGLTPGPDGLSDSPHFGRVIVQDSVTIGANSCVDRGALDDTVIGEGTKIDNLCQIAHNVVLGRGVVMAAFAGLSGSVRIGDHVQLGGRVGLVDHIEIGEGASVSAGSAVYRSVPAGAVWGGAPAQPLARHLREQAWLRRAARRGERNT